MLAVIGHGLLLGAALKFGFLVVTPVVAPVAPAVAVAPADGYAARITWEAVVAEARQAELPPPEVTATPRPAGDRRLPEPAADPLPEPLASVDQEVPAVFESFSGRRAPVVETADPPLQRAAIVSAVRSVSPSSTPPASVQGTQPEPPRAEAAPSTPPDAPAPDAPAPDAPLPNAPLPNAPAPDPETVPANPATGTAAGLVTAPVAAEDNPPPRYPRLSRRRGEEGTVVLDVDVDPEGTVRSLRVSRTSGFERLDEAAREAVAGWIFTPAQAGGVAVGHTTEVRVRFQLTD